MTAELRAELATVLERVLGPEPTVDELKELHELFTEWSSEAHRKAHQRAYERFIGPRPFCVTPNGRYDSHGVYVRFKGPMKFACAFCGRSIHATPSDPEGERQHEKAKRRRRAHP